MASVAMCAFQHSTVAGLGRSLACSCTPLALSVVCSPAPLRSLSVVVSDESSNEDGGDWSGSEGWHGGCGEMSGGVEIAFYLLCRVRLAAFLMRGVAPHHKNKTKSTQKRAGVSWWSCPGPRMTKGTRKTASKTPQEVDERENPSLLNRPQWRSARSRISFYVSGGVLD